MGGVSHNREESYSGSKPFTWMWLNLVSLSIKQLLRITKTFDGNQAMLWCISTAISYCFCLISGQIIFIKICITSCCVLFWFPGKLNILSWGQRSRVLCGGEDSYWQSRDSLILCTTKAFHSVFGKTITSIKWLSTESEVKTEWKPFCRRESSIVELWGGVRKSHSYWLDSRIRALNKNQLLCKINNPWYYLWYPGSFVLLKSKINFFLHSNRCITQRNRWRLSNAFEAIDWSFAQKNDFKNTSGIQWVYEMIFQLISIFVFIVLLVRISGHFDGNCYHKCLIYYRHQSEAQRGVGPRMSVFLTKIYYNFF